MDELKAQMIEEIKKQLDAGTDYSFRRAQALIEGVVRITALNDIEEAEENRRKR